MEIDSSGDIQWQRTYGGPTSSDNDKINSIVQTPDGGYIAAGFTESFDLAGGDAWVLRLSEDGSLEGCAAVNIWSGNSSDTSEIGVEITVGVTTTGTVTQDTVVAAEPFSLVFHDGCKYYSNMVQLPETGQTTSYHERDDGALKTGVEWPAPRFTDNGDGTITDNLTGLMWLKDGNCAATIGISENGAMNWTSALGFVSGINSGTYDVSSCASYSGTYSDWRLPNINELESLVNLEIENQANWLTGEGFTNLQAAKYWSSTSSPANSLLAFYVNMANGYIRGHVDGTSKGSSKLHVLPVRGGQMDVSDPAYPANVWKTGQTTSYEESDDGDIQAGVILPSPRFTDNGDGTITDNLTGLMWLKDCACLGKTRWGEALTTVSEFNSNPDSYSCQDYTASYGDWRMPNRKELLSMIDRSRTNPALPLGPPFVGISTDYSVWSSSTYAGSTGSAWSFSMRFGLMWHTSKSYSRAVWAVRSIPSKCKADFDHDGDVDGVDLAVFGHRFATTEAHEFILEMFAREFGTTSCPLLP